MRGFERATVFDLLDYLTSNFLLPLGGFAIAVFAGWVVPAGVLAEELRLGPRAARALRFLLRVRRAGGDRRDDAPAVPLLASAGQSFGSGGWAWVFS